MTPISEPIDEVTRRRPDSGPAADCEWITLGDGGAWAFPRPGVQSRVAFEGGRAVRRYAVRSYGPAVDALLKLAAGVDDPEVAMSVAASIAAALLRRHYELSDADLDGLLCGRGGDPDSWAWARRVIELATGIVR